ncbi:MAG: pyrroline-5-carboxylate reductase [Firmicutes bacterium]|nr:pyrroline-5-carboxylate reductase [Bacillota bacterium]
MKIGFIGSGVMGSALAKAVSRSGEGTILVSDVDTKKAEALAKELGGQTALNNEIAREADYIFLAVKPQYMAGMLEGIKDVLAAREDRFVIVSMAAGLAIRRIKELAGGDYPLIRIMPNTPASIGQGVVIVSPDQLVTEEEISLAMAMLSPAGKLVRLSEKQLDAGGSISGCGPAFVDLFVEALADGGVLCGVPRKEAMELAAQMVLGSAALILESGKHPGELKDMVCSPGGTTIEGVRVLENGAFRSTVMEAVIASYEKNAKLG